MHWLDVTSHPLHHMTAMTAINQGGRRFVLALTKIKVAFQTHFLLYLHFSSLNLSTPQYVALITCVQTAQFQGLTEELLSGKIPFGKTAYVHMLFSVCIHTTSRNNEVQDVQEYPSFLFFKGCC